MNFRFDNNVNYPFGAREENNSNSRDAENEFLPNRPRSRENKAFKRQPSL